jgi:hypothetical protein
MESIRSSINNLNIIKEKFKIRTNRKFKSYFGVKESVALYLIEKSKNLISYEDVMLTLYHLKNNLIFDVAHLNFNLSYSTFHKKFWRGVRILNNLLQNFNFSSRLLTSTLYKEQFFINNNVFGVIDATEIKINNPYDSLIQNTFYSGKKKFTSVKYQIVIDIMSKKIIHVSCCYPGKVHDITIFKIFIQQVSNHIIFNENFLADKGYKSEQYEGHLITPIKNSILTTDEYNYNFFLSTHRIKIENVISVIKRFRILKNAFRYDLRKHSIVFNLCCKLANLMLELED